MKPRGKVKAEINSSNPWYVSEQLPNLNDQNQIRTIEQRWHFINKIFEKVHSLYPDRKLNVLDAGCGDGINLTILSKIPYADVTACDYNPVRVERTKRAYPDIKVMQLDLTNALFNRMDFDIILCSQVLEHIPEDMKVLKELNRILSPDGILILGIPNEGCFFAKLRNHVLEPYIARTTDHVHFFTEKELLKKFNSTGFCVADKLSQNFFFPKQSMSNFFASRDSGFKFMNILQRIFPSQSAGFYFALMRNNSEIKSDIW